MYKGKNLYKRMELYEKIEADPTKTPSEMLEADVMVTWRAIVAFNETEGKERKIFIGKLHEDPEVFCGRHYYVAQLGSWVFTDLRGKFVEFNKKWVIAHYELNSKGEECCTSMELLEQSEIDVSYVKKLLRELRK